MTDIADFATFAHWHIDSGDIDPAYPVLARLAEAMHLNRSDVADLVFLYVTYYNLPSALRVIEGEGTAWPSWESLASDRWLNLPTGTERRAHRSKERLRAHLVALDQLREAHGGLDRWVHAQMLPTSPRDNWRRLQAALRTIDGNGRWAGYKTGEILAYMGLPLKPTDAGHDFSSGPRRGLALLYPATARLHGHQPATVAKLDKLTEELRREVSDRLQHEVPVEQLETVLCDWHSVVEGRYYVGHDIDQQLQQLALAPLGEEMRARAMDARARSFHRRWLGESGGWEGVRPWLRKLWVEQKELVWWA